MPKQFVRLFGNRSLFQLTATRNKKFCDKSLIVSNTEQYFVAHEQIDELKDDKLVNIKYLLEPIGRNTAPAITLACLSLNKDDIVLITPSDHLIKNEKQYQKVIKQAQKLAEQNNLVTFGIKPDHPNTEYGYIESDNKNVISFTEKPDIKTAEKYLKKGNFYWNSGMFMFKAGVFLDELQKHSPTIYQKSKIAFDGITNNNNSMFVIEKSKMADIPADSIDYAVMEKSNKVKVVLSDIGWSDLGSFDALFKELPKDKNNNTKNKEYIGVDSKNNLIYGNDRKITTIDITDTIIVDTGDALLISKKGSSNKVQQVVAEIKKDKSQQLHNIHLTGYRPWGSYTVLEDKTGYKIKKIKVKPQKRLSLQSHKHRNEHWVVVKGEATVTINDKTFKVAENQSTYIKAGDKHRLSNLTDKPLIIIESQVGSYTGEDDIKRYDDDFNRDRL